jgi:hypothetical protein
LYRARRKAAFSSAFAAGLSVGSGIAQAPNSYANVTSYSRSAGVSYADTWWDARNNHYNDLGDNDCTNFMSQIMENGGTAQNGDWYMYQGVGGFWHWSASWGAAQNWQDYQFNSHFENGSIYATSVATSLPNDPITDSILGDFFVLHQSAEPPDVGYWNHLMFEVGTVYVDSWYDQYSGWAINYSEFVDVIDQHSHDRYHAPWNGGWEVAATENTEDWKNWVAVVAHINT